MREDCNAEHASDVAAWFPNEDARSVMSKLWLAIFSGAVFSGAKKKPLYLAPTTALTSTGFDDSATPITPVPPPNAPVPAALALLKLLTKKPDAPIPIRSRLEG